MTAIPSHMTYVGFDHLGEPQAMKLMQGPVPKIRSDDVLIKVIAAGVNYPDIMQRKGYYPPPPGSSPILGLEIAGEVVVIGEDCKKWHVGDQVCALTNGGGYAQYVSVPQGQCLPIPNGMSMVEASALPEVYFTVWANVFQRGKLKKGEAFLVHGGAGGIGSAAIQLAKAFGADVYTTCSSKHKCDFAEKLGAKLAVNYQQADFVEEIMNATQQQGVDMILDFVAGDYFPKNISLLKRDGRLVQISSLKGKEVCFDVRQLLFKRLTITGSTLRPMTSQQKGEIADELLEKVWPLFKQGLIRPVNIETFPIQEAAKAHELMESGQHMGKIVLELHST